MSTLSLDTPRNFEVNEDPVFGDLPVIADDIIYEGAAVGDNGSGNARPLVAGDPFWGFADRKADNTGGSASGINVRVRQKGSLVLTVTGASAITDVGLGVYATDDDTFTLTAGGTFIGIVARWVTSTTCVVHYVAEHLRHGVIRPAEDHTAADTLLAAESGSIHTNVGATGTFALTLPSAVVGLEFFFQIGAAEILQIEPASGETISLPSTGVKESADDYIAADLAGETVHLMCCIAGTWSVMGYTGTWTGQ